MQIRNKLSLYFTITSSLLMLVIMTFIYLLFSNLTKSDFYTALHTRTEVAAQLYLEADEISPAALNRIKEKFVISLPHEVIRVYDSTDEVSFTRDTDQNWNKEVIREVRQKKYLAYRDNKKQVVGIYYEDNQGNFVILASAIDVDGQERKKNLLGIMSVLFGIQILIQFIAGRWFAQRALLPIQKVNAQVQNISVTGLHLRVETNSEKDELGELSANFNSLLERLEQSFDLQKMFVANASHELRTPITNIMGEIEVALNKERTSADYTKTLQSVLVEADRLNDIIRNFLLLANAEKNLASQLNEHVRFDELLWEIKENFSRHPGALIDIQLFELPEDEQRLNIKANKTLLSLALSNIIENGIKFSGDQPVAVSLHITANTIIIRITDNGIGMDEETLRNIFEPFFRSTSAENYQGHGIGLYIAKKIIELMSGTITVQSQPDKGSVFNIIFPQNVQI